MRRAVALLFLIMIGAILVAGCTSNQDEELKTTLHDSSQSMVKVLEDVGRDASNMNIVGMIQSGRALETESRLWYDKISAIKDISPEWLPVKTNYLKALDLFSSAGKKSSDAGLAFQRGDYTSSVTLMEQATADMTSGSRYMDEALAAIPK